MSTRVKKKFLRYVLLLFVFLGAIVLSGCSLIQFETALSQQGPIIEDVKKQNQEKSQAEVISKAEEPPLATSQTNLEEHADLKPPVNINTPMKQSETLKKSIPVLYYHSIDYEEGNELRVPPEEFESHMQLLNQNGYESISINELYQYLYEGKDLPEKAFALTFDDGYEDNYTNAFPIAEKYGFQGTIFMVTNWIDGTGYLKREQLLEMSQAGWQIESHTMTHPYLDSISSEQIKVEISSSKKVLEELLGKTVKVIAYPYGVYDPLIQEVSKNMGYLMGLTTDRGWANAEDPFRVKRIYCYANMGLDELKRRIENPNY